MVVLDRELELARLERALCREPWLLDDSPREYAERILATIEHRAGCTLARAQDE